MPKLTDTYARAYDCCDRILTELGRFPTIDLIRDRIGINSPTTIKKAMNEWTQHFAEQHFDKINRPELPATLLHSAEQVWKLAVIEAEKTYLQKEQGYQQIIAESHAAVADLQSAQASINQVLLETKNQLAECGQKNQNLQQQLQEQIQLSDELRGQLATNAKHLADQQTAMQEQAQRWQQQQAQDQMWFARRLSEEKQFIEEKWQEKVQRQGLQIAALTESESSLRQACASLRQEQQRLQHALAVYQQQSEKNAYRFKPKAKQKLKIGTR